MNEWKVIFATAVIFGAGVITGGLLVNYVDHGQHKGSSHHAPPPVTVASTNANPQANVPMRTGEIHPRLPEILSKQFVDRLDTDLQLTLEQRADIEKIIADSQNDMRRAVQDVRQTAREQIRKQLTPGQAKRFDDLFKQSHSGKKTVIVTNAPPEQTNSQ